MNLKFVKDIKRKRYLKFAKIVQNQLPDYNIYIFLIKITKTIKIKNSSKA